MNTGSIRREHRAEFRYVPVGSFAEYLSAEARTPADFPTLEGLARAVLLVTASHGSRVRVENRTAPQLTINHPRARTVGLFEYRISAAAPSHTMFGDEFTFRGELRVRQRCGGVPDLELSEVVVAVKGQHVVGPRLWAVRHRLDGAISEFYSAVKDELAIAADRLRTLSADPRPQPSWPRVWAFTRPDGETMTQEWIAYHDGHPPDPRYEGTVLVPGRCRSTSGVAW